MIEKERDEIGKRERERERRYWRKCEIGVGMIEKEREEVREREREERKGYW